MTGDKDVLQIGRKNCPAQPPKLLPVSGSGSGGGQQAERFGLTAGNALAFAPSSQPLDSTAVFERDTMQMAALAREPTL